MIPIPKTLPVPRPRLAGFRLARLRSGRPLSGRPLSGAGGRHLGGDDGMSTVEYAIGTIAAAAFAAVLYAVVSGDDVVNALTDLVRRALDPGL